MVALDAAGPITVQPVASEHNTSLGVQNAVLSAPKMTWGRTQTYPYVESWGKILLLSLIFSDHIMGKVLI